MRWIPTSRLVASCPKNESLRAFFLLANACASLSRMRYLPPTPKRLIIGRYSWAEPEADENGVKCTILSVSNPPPYNEIGPWRTEAFAERLALYVHRKMQRAGPDAGADALDVPLDFWSSVDSDPTMTEQESREMLRYWVMLQGPQQPQPANEPYRVRISVLIDRRAPAMAAAAAVAAVAAPPVTEWMNDWLFAFLFLLGLAMILPLHITYPKYK